MKLAIPASGELITSKYCPDFEECEFLIIYDTKTKHYASRKSPSFYSKNPDDLINFLKAVMIKNIITGKDLNDGYFKVFKINEKNLSVEDVIMRYKEEKSSYL
ncbi:NifB/NifX family molybdenum-iron cluster-binding protein [Nautilia sp.]